MFEKNSNNYFNIFNQERIKMFEILKIKKYIQQLNRKLMSTDSINYVTTAVLLTSKLRIIREYKVQAIDVYILSHFNNIESE